MRRSQSSFCAAPSLSLYSIVTPDFARVLTEQQSQAVVAYLQDSHKAQKTGWWFWKTRKVTALGHGLAPTPVPEPTPLPAARVEVIVFVPPE